jgi:putative ABC transport system substrate-binding protein
MRRRDFIKAIAYSATGCPLAARAQQGIRRIGVLMGTAETDPVAQDDVRSLREGLQELGWLEGQNIQVELRWGNADVLLMQRYSADLVQSKVDVLLGQAPAVTGALQQATHSIPIVFVMIPDPVEAGFVTSISHPGSNITGFTHFDPTMGGKWLEVLKGIAPAVDRVAIVFNPVTVSRAYFPPLVGAARSFAVEAFETPIHDAAEIERAVDTFAQVPKGGLVVLPDVTTTVHRKSIIKLAAQLLLPAVYPWAYFVREGGLVSYGVNRADLFRRAASYIDRILRGERPEHLPVQGPIKFETAIYAKTAKALGLIVPPGLLVTADEVID